MESTIRRSGRAMRLAKLGLRKSEIRYCIDRSRCEQSLERVCKVRRSRIHVGLGFLVHGSYEISCKIRKSCQARVIVALSLGSKSGVPNSKRGIETSTCGSWSSIFSTMPPVYFAVAILTPFADLFDCSAMSASS